MTQMGPDEQRRGSGDRGSSGSSVASRDLGAPGLIMGAVAVASVAGSVALAAGSRTQPVLTMDQAAARFVESLTPAQRESTVFPYDSPKRLDWHYVPRNRAGLLLKDMTDAQR